MLERTNAFTGETYTLEQAQRRTYLLERLIAYYTNPQLCGTCKSGPDWRTRIHELTLEQLEKRHAKLYNLPLPLTPDPEVPEL